MTIEQNDYNDAILQVTIKWNVYNDTVKHYWFDWSYEKKWFLISLVNSYYANLSFLAFLYIWLCHFFFPLPFYLLIFSICLSISFFLPFFWYYSFILLCFYFIFFSFSSTFPFSFFVFTVKYSINWKPLIGCMNGKQFVLLCFFSIFFIKRLWDKIRFFLYIYLLFWNFYAEFFGWWGLKLTLMTQLESQYFCCTVVGIQCYKLLRRKM